MSDNPKRGPARCLFGHPAFVVYPSLHLFGFLCPVPLQPGVKHLDFFLGDAARLVIGMALEAVGTNTMEVWSSVQRNKAVIHLNHMGHLFL